MVGRAAPGPGGPRPSPGPAGPRRFPRRFHPGAVVAALGALVAALAVAAATDHLLLARHASSGPSAFAGADCAGAPPDAATSTPSPGTALSALGLTEWPTFGGDTSHAPTLLAAGPGGAGLAASWSFRTNGSIVTSPAVAGGVAYFGSMDGCVYAVNVATGALLWSFAADNQVMSQPLVVDGRVFFGTGDKIVATRDGASIRGTGQSALYAVDARTGKELWMVPTEGESMPTPAYAGGVVYEADGARNFYALSASTGALLWKTSTGVVDSMSSPAISGDIAVFGGADPFALVGVSLTSHDVAWTLPLPEAQAGVDDGSAAIAGGVAFVQVPEGGRFARRVVEMAVQAEGGHLLWQRTLGTDHLDELQRALWHGDMDAFGGEEVGIATVEAGIVYVGSPGLRGLWALRASDGSPLWRGPARLAAGIRTAPAVAGGLVYAAGDNRLYVLQEATGRVLGSVPLGRWALTAPLMEPCTTPSPLVLGDTVLVGAGDEADTLRAIPVAALAAG